MRSVGKLLLRKQGAAVRENFHPVQVLAWTNQRAKFRHPGTVIKDGSSASFLTIKASTAQLLRGAALKS
jgi:hypothetical protein